MPLRSSHLLHLAPLIVIGFSLRTVEAAEGEVNFAAEIKPILERACVQCHGPEKQKGKLRLDSREAWLKGGDNGPAFTAGHPEKSDFFNRVTLADDHDDVMPPKGKADHLTPAQIDLVKRWITQGAVWPEGVLAVATTDAAAGGRDPREVVGPAPSPDELRVIADLTRRGIKVRPLASGINWRRADLRSVADKVTPELLARLTSISNLQELDLSGVRLADEDLASFVALKNLAVLHLENTRITDAGLAHLGRLEKLRYLNLFGTNVTDRGLKDLATLKNLKSLYVAGTKVTAQGLESLKQKLPNLEIESGNDFAEIAKKDPEPPPKKPAATPAPPAEAVKPAAAPPVPAKP
jgi:mono/diheme cytochrome c family protein